MTFKTLTSKENTMNAKRIVIAASVVTSVVVGIVAARDLALAVLLLAAFVFGLRYIARGATMSGYEGFYGRNGGGAWVGGFGDGGFGAGGFGDGGFGGGGDGGGGGA
jgi:hypothetical protein